MTALVLTRAVTARGLEPIGPFADPAAALRLLRTRQPLAALLDVSLSGGATSEPVARVLAEAGVPFAFLTGYGPETGPVVRAFPQALVIPKPADEATLGVLLDELVG